MAQTTERSTPQARSSVAKPAAQAARERQCRRRRLAVLALGAKVLAFTVFSLSLSVQQPELGARGHGQSLVAPARSSARR